MYLHQCSLCRWLWVRNRDFNLSGAPPAELQLGFSGQTLLVVDLSDEMNTVLSPNLDRGVK